VNFNLQLDWQQSFQSFPEFETLIGSHSLAVGTILLAGASAMTLSSSSWTATSSTEDQLALEEPSSHEPSPTEFDTVVIEASSIEETNTEVPGQLVYVTDETGPVETSLPNEKGKAIISPVRDPVMDTITNPIVSQTMAKAVGDKARVIELKSLARAVATTRQETESMNDLRRKRQEEKLDITSINSSSMPLRAEQHVETKPVLEDTPGTTKRPHITRRRRRLLLKLMKKLLFPWKKWEVL